jgi:AraC family transcriptional regulator
VSLTYRFHSPKAVLYARAHGPYAASSFAAWNLMLDWLDQRRARARVPRGIGVIRDDPAKTGQFLRRYDACVEIIPGLESDLHAGIGRQTLPGGTYAVHMHKGAHQAISETLSALHRQWLPQTGHVIDDTRSFQEVYLNDPATTAPEDLRTELCIPILTTANRLTIHTVANVA